MHQKRLRIQWLTMTELRELNAGVDLEQVLQQIEANKRI